MDRSFLVITLPLLIIIAAAAIWFFSRAESAAAPVGAAATTTAATAGNTAAVASSSAPASAGSTSSTNTQPMQATLHTSMGDITIQFDAADAPQTVANFVKLAQSGFYDGVKFHRVIQGFMDQAGDPLTKDDSKEAQWGTGGPGYTIPDENQNAHNGPGVVSMANTGQPNSGGSQFFINAVDNGFLDGKYSVFGKVISGMDVVTAINNTPVDSSDRPLTPVVLKSVTLQ